MQKALTLLSATLFLLFGFLPVAQAQLCTGSLGDPVVNITFGAGNNPGPPLKAATTAYTYTTSSCPNDGSYTVTNVSNSCFSGSWHSVDVDHTGDPKGYYMLVNASFQPSDFYLDTVHNLCGNTTYQFSAWILNMIVPNNPNCPGGSIRPNITFNIETTTGAVLGTYNTGNIVETAGNDWAQYGLFFVTPPNVSDVVLRMTNNAPGGCGNDLALDDITFRPCGPMVSATISGGNGAASISLCQDDPTIFTFNSAISSGYNAPASQWQLSTDSGVTWHDIVGATSTTYTRQPTAPGNYEYRLAVAEGNNIVLPTCRVSSNVLQVIINPKPIPAAANDGPKCAGNTVNLTAANGSLYNWTGPNGFTASGSPVSIVNSSAADSGKYYVTVTSSAGCVRADSTYVIVYTNPVAQFNPIIPACEKNAISFTDLSSPSGQTLVKWNWDFGDGSVDSVQDPVHRYDTAGIYPVTLIVTTDKGCKSLPQVNALPVHDLPHPDFSLPEICLADPFAFFYDSTTIADGTQGQFTYQWNFGDPNANATFPNVSTQKDPTHKYQAAGPYTVSLAVMSGDGCVKDTAKTFTVNGSFPQAIFSVGNVTGLCSNQPVTLTDASTVTPGNIIRVEIYWDYLHDPTIKTTDSTPVAGRKYSHLYPFFSSPATESFLIQYVVYSGISCVNQSRQTITVNASPQVIFDSLSPICEEARPYDITQAREIDGFTGFGVYSGRGITNAGLFDPSAVGSGSDTLWYTFTASNGCSARDSQTIIVYPQPRADAGPAQYMLQGGNTILEGSGSGDQVSFLWLPDSAIDDQHIARPTVAPSDDLIYTLSVTSAQGCVASSQVSVTVLKIPVVPNAFSPNGDGINDTWVIRYLGEYPGAEVEVFNRYGQPVYHVIGYTTPWDGTYKGQPLPVGTYYWVIDPKFGRKKISGSVTILR